MGQALRAVSEPEFVDVSALPLVADERWYYGSQNGSAPEQPWTPVKLAEIPDEPPVQPTLGELGIAYPGKRHVFSGPQESAKTLCAYILGLEVLRHDGLFCLIDFEMGRWEARNRLRELGATNAELAHVLYFEPEGRMPEHVPEVIRSHCEERNAIVVIDAAAGAFAFEELDDNKRMDVERFGARYVEPFRKAGIATLVLDHVVKSSEARGAYAIGSERKVGQTDIHLGFSVVTPIKRGGHGIYKVTTHKDRGGFLKRGKLADFELASDPASHAISWTLRPAVEADEDHPFRPTHLMEKVSRYLERQTEPVAIGEVKSTVEGKATYVVEAVNILIEDGFISESVGPRNARLLESIRAYREAEDDPFPTRSHPFPDEGQSTRSPFPLSREERVGDDEEVGNGSQHSLDEEIPF